MYNTFNARKHAHTRTHNHTHTHTHTHTICIYNGVMCDMRTSCQFIYTHQGKRDLGEDCLEDAAENEDCNQEEDDDGGDLRERGHDGLFDVDKDRESVAEMYQGLRV